MAPPMWPTWLDQSHGEKLKIEAMIQTICTLQSIYARSLLVDWKALSNAQQTGDIVGAENVLVRAFNTDVEPLLAQVREELGLRPTRWRPIGEWLSEEDRAGTRRARGFWRTGLEHARAVVIRRCTWRGWP